jgi:hypothetical protein
MNSAKVTSATRPTPRQQFLSRRGRIRRRAKDRNSIRAISTPPLSLRILGMARDPEAGKRKLRKKFGIWA